MKGHVTRQNATLSILLCHLYSNFEYKEISCSYQYLLLELYLYTQTPTFPLILLKGEGVVEENIL